MRFVVLGAGGVGSFVGGMLARAGHDVTLVARGAHLNAVAGGGLRVRGTRASFAVRVRATDAAAQFAGATDVLLVAVKAHDLATTVEDVAAFVAGGATVVTMQNGVPFWFFEEFHGPLGGARLAGVDPTGAIAAAFGTRTLVACVVDAGTRIPEAGTVEQVGWPSYTLGTPDPAAAARAATIAAAFCDAGLDATTDSDVRAAVWRKLAGNAALNPLSALTKASAQEIADDAGAIAILREGIAETLALGQQLGLHVPFSTDAWITALRTYGDQRTSMLQDREAGRRLELGAIVAAPVEIAARLHMGVPTLSALLALSTLLERGTPAHRRER